MTLIWTTTKPTVPGWYWWRHNTELDVLNVKLIGKKTPVFMVLSGINTPLCAMPGEWAGPIEQPEEGA